MKLINNEVLTFCADDAHGAPIMMKADELRLNATDFIDEVKVNHEKSLARYGIEYTNYHSTHSQENEILINEIYHDAQSAGYIYKKEIEQLKERSIIVKKLKPLPFESVVRGYIIGSGWSDYKKNKK